MNMLIENSAIKMIDTSSYAMRKTMGDVCQIERHEPPVLMLDAQGFIRECGTAIEKLFGYCRHELIWQHISCLFPKLADVALVQGERLNPMLYFICHCDHDFEALNKHSDIIMCNLSFFLNKHEGRPMLRMIVRPVANAKVMAAA